MQGYRHVRVIGQCCKEDQGFSFRHAELFHKDKGRNIQDAERCTGQSFNREICATFRF